MKEIKRYKGKYYYYTLVSTRERKFQKRMSAAYKQHIKKILCESNILILVSPRLTQAYLRPLRIFSFCLAGSNDIISANPSAVCFGSILKRRASFCFTASPFNFLI